MRDAEIRKGASSVEGVIEGESLILNSRVPDSIRRARITRGSAVPARAPGPMHSIARVNHHRVRRETETTVGNCDCNSGRACPTRAETQ